MAQWKCQTCGFTFEEQGEPTKCPSCTRQGTKRKPGKDGFTKLVIQVPPPTAEKPLYHWKCKSCGYQSVNPGVPVECPNCTRQGLEQKGFQALSDAARLSMAESALENEDMGEPVESWKKAEMITWLIKKGVHTIELADGTVKRLDECENVAPPNKKDIFALIQTVMGESSPEGETSET